MNHAPPLVIVLDDDAAVRRALSRLFEAEGYAVTVHASAAEYLKSPVPLTPACLVLDVKMPGQNGLELQRELAEAGREESIVFITGHGEVPMCVQAMKAGAVDFLLKPFASRDLLAAVARALDRARSLHRSSAARERARALLARLTPREMEVFRLIIAGMLNKQIGAQLGSTEKTVKNQRAQIIAKLGISAVADMVRLAARAAPL